MGSIAYVTTKPVHLQSDAFDSIDCDGGERGVGRGGMEEFREEAPSLNARAFARFVVNYVIR